MKNIKSFPVISVLIPVYNKGNYIEKTLDSVLNQDYFNLEIILLDDGSTDNSLDICNIYAKKDSRIKVFHQENFGASIARNKALSLATGDYVSFIDADDIIISNYYSYMYELLVKYNTDIVECKFLRIFSNEKLNENKEFLANIKENEKIEVLNNKKALERIFSIDNTTQINAVILCNKLYKRNCFKNIYFPEHKLNEDEYIEFEILYNNCKTIAISNKKLYIYIQAKNSIMTAGLTEQRIVDNINSQLNYIEFFKMRNEYFFESKAMRKYLYRIFRTIEHLEAGEGLNNITTIENLNKQFKLGYDLYINSIKKYMSNDEIDMINKLDTFYLKLN